MCDPRAYAPDFVHPPAPLPYVHKGALRRVKDWMSPPTHCNYCRQDTVKLVENKAVYGQNYGTWPYLYWCEDCDAYVGLHPKTDLPLGTLANRELREARKQHKKTFIKLQRRAGWSRSQSYQWLAGQMGIPSSRCHWAWFTVNQCVQAGALCQHQLAELSPLPAQFETIPMNSGQFTEIIRQIGLRVTSCGEAGSGSGGETMLLATDGEVYLDWRCATPQGQPLPVPLALIPRQFVELARTVVGRTVVGRGFSVEPHQESEVCHD